MMPMPNLSLDSDDQAPCCRLVTPEGRELPLESVSLDVSARGGVARVTLRQTFHNAYDEPLTVRYQVPLPADAAVSGFSFELAGQRIVGEVDRKAKARERYEEAIVAGHSAAILDQERSSLFTQDVGNVPPGQDVVTELVLDQKLRWVMKGNDVGSWEWRFPTVVAPRYLGPKGRVRDAASISPDIATEPLSPRMSLSLSIDESLAEGGRVVSPTHPIISRRNGRRTDAGFAEEQGAQLDRDIAVRWPVAAPTVGASVALSRPAASKPRSNNAFGLLTLVPPHAHESSEVIARDLIVLLDTSGSMGGAPLAQAQRVTRALIDTLDEKDSLELIEFSMRPRRYKKRPVRMSAKERRAADAWVAKLSAGGGTEMHSGIMAALDSIRGDAQRQVVVITDGLIGFEDEIVRAIRERLPVNGRVHTVGVGSGVNRTLTQGAARAGHGVEILIAYDEDPEAAAERIVARTAAPLLVDVELSGDVLRAHHPERLPDLFAGAPALASLALDPKGGELLVRGTTPAGPWEQQIAIAPCAPAEGDAAITALFARESVEDLEMHSACGEQVDSQIETLGVDFQIATRLTSWVAISDDATVDPRDPSRHETMPHQLPHGMSVGSLGLRAAMPAFAPQMLTQAGAMVGAVASGMLRAPFGGAPPAPAPAAAAPPPGRGRAAAAPPATGYGAADEEFDMEFAYDTDAPQPPKALAEEAMPEDALAEEARTPGAAKKSAGPLRRMATRVLDGVREMFGDRTIELEGRVVSQSDSELIVTFELPEDLLWEPELVELELSDGSRITMSIDDERTTRDGKHRRGQTLRIALVGPEEPIGGRPQHLHIVNGDAALVIHL